MSSQLHEVLVFPNVGDSLSINVTADERILYRCQLRIGNEEGEWDDSEIEQGVNIDFKTRKTHTFDLWVVFVDPPQVNQTAVTIEHCRQDEPVETWKFDKTDLNCATHKVHLITIDAIVG